MLKKGFLAVLVLLLLTLPSAIRWFVYYDGRYEPDEVPRPKVDEIEAPAPELSLFEDSFSTSAPGVILVDMAHLNRFEMRDLEVLQARLAARGQRFEPVVTLEDLKAQLRYAKALVVVSPGLDWTPKEINLIQGFVENGGRLLLITDPTRYGVEYDEWDYPILDDDVNHINDLAARFGILFQPDYLYNTSDNAGNFRNIRLREFDTQPVTQGLRQVVFYAAHSITSEEQTLILTDGETRSSQSERDQPLSVAVQAAHGKVLALGDLTFMAQPNNAIYDNDQFISNIADFLAGAERDYDLVDFPYFFADQTDLVYTGDPLLDSDLLTGGSALQSLFTREGKELTLRDAEDSEADTLFFGLYEQAEEVAAYLELADVTLWITPTEEATDGSTPDSEQPSTSAPATTQNTKPEASPAITFTSPITPAAKPHIQIGALGNMVVTGTSLLLLQNDGDRHVLVVLADTDKGLGTAVERLSSGTFDKCLFRVTEAPGRTSLVLCPTGEVAAGQGSGGWQTEKPTEEAPPEAESTDPVTETVKPDEGSQESWGSILVVALDHGKGRYAGLTSAEDYDLILSERYDVEIWSTGESGLPGMEELLNYDLVIWTAGDYEDSLGDDESDLMFDAALEGMPTIVSGAFVYDSEITAVQRDIQIFDSDHPMAKGFEADEIITFVDFPMGDGHETSVMDDVVEEEGTFIPFVRGPESEKPAVPSVFVMEDSLSEVRLVVIGFPVYLLPGDAKARLVSNTVDWLLGP